GGVARVLAHPAQHHPRRLVAGGELRRLENEGANSVERKQRGERPADAECDGTDLFQCPLDQADLALAGASDVLEAPGQLDELAVGELTFAAEAFDVLEQTAIERPGGLVGLAAELLLVDDPS